MASPPPPPTPSPLFLSPAVFLSYLSLVQQAQADGILAQPHKAPGAVNGVQHPVPPLHWSHTHISHAFVHQISIMVQLLTTGGTIYHERSAAVCGNHLLTASTAKLWHRLHSEADCAGAHNEWQRQFDSQTLVATQGTRPKPAGHCLKCGETQVMSHGCGKSSLIWFELVTINSTSCPAEGERTASLSKKSAQA